MQTAETRKPKGLKARLLRWLGLTNEVTIKVYHGYGYVEQFNIYGHVFSLSPLPRKKYRKSFVRNTLALLRLFMVKPCACMHVELEWEQKKFSCETDRDGF